MAINYRRLWKLLIDKNMKKCDLQEKAGLSSSTIAKLGKNEAVMSDVIDRICLALDCRIEEIMEVEHGKTLPPIQATFQTDKIAIK